MSDTTTELELAAMSYFEVAAVRDALRARVSRLETVLLAIKARVLREPTCRDEVCLMIDDVLDEGNRPL